MIRLPAYHCDLNAIELIWADEKNYVARENREMTLKSVEALFLERRSQITAEKYKNFPTGKQIGLLIKKIDKLEIALDANEDESDIETDILVTKMNNKQNSLNRYIFRFMFYFYYPAHNTFYFRFDGF